MKIYVLLFISTLCVASEKQTTINTNITVNQNEAPVPPPPPRSQKWRGGFPQKHPSVIEAHGELQRIQQERDAVTCCCFFKIKKKI